MALSVEQLSVLKGPGRLLGPCIHIQLQVHADQVEEARRAFLENQKSSVFTDSVPLQEKPHFVPMLLKQNWEQFVEDSTKQSSSAV